MQQITLKINNDKKLKFLLELLSSFSFVTDIQTQKKDTEKKVVDKKDKVSIDDFAGLWSENPKSLEQIRAKGWNRNL